MTGAQRAFPGFDWLLGALLWRGSGFKCPDVLSQHFLQNFKK